MLWFDCETALTGSHPWSLPVIHFLILAMNGPLPYALSAVMFRPSARSRMEPLKPQSQRKPESISCFHSSFCYCEGKSNQLKRGKFSGVSAVGEGGILGMEGKLSFALL